VGGVCVERWFDGPKGQDSLARALAWVFRFIAGGPEGARDALEPNVEPSNRILRHRQADRSSNYGRLGIHPSQHLGRLLHLLHWTSRPEIRVPLQGPTR
jgi:hypothetical protein